MLLKLFTLSVGTGIKKIIFSFLMVAIKKRRGWLTVYKMYIKLILKNIKLFHVLYCHYVTAWEIYLVTFAQYWNSFQKRINVFQKTDF